VSYAPEMSDGRLNILFITLDEFRADCLSAAGHQVVRTPALDALCSEGVRFAKHFGQAAPCAPGRAALYTGTYQMNNRVVMNGSPLDDRFDNIARAARRTGYDPVLFGYTDQAIDPRTVAEDDPRLQTYEGVLPGFRCELDLTQGREAWADWVRAQGYDMPVEPEEGLATESERPADVGISAFLTDRFLEWLPKQNEPWFAHLSHLRPHPPFAAAGEWSTAFDPAEVDLPAPVGTDLHPLHEFLLSISYFAAPSDEDGMRKMRAQYYGMISDVDAQLDRVWNALRESSQWDNTIVIVTSDHGEQLGDQGMVQKMGWFEASFHIPLIIRDPRRPEISGDVVDVFTEAVDVFPTLCDVMNVPIPKQCDGRSLRPFLDGETSEDWRDAAYWEFDWRFFSPGRDGAQWPQDRRSAQRQLTVRRSDDVAYVQFADGEALVYDLVADPNWTTLLDDPERAWCEARAMLAWRAQHTDRTLTGIFFP
jgi:arylsulfatase A-like enzyme